MEGDDEAVFSTSVVALVLNWWIICVWLKKAGAAWVYGEADREVGGGDGLR